MSLECMYDRPACRAPNPRTASSEDDVQAIVGVPMFDGDHVSMSWNRKRSKRG